VRYPLGRLTRLLITGCAIAFLLASPVWASGAQTAREFLEQAYGKYAAGGKGPDTLGKDAPELFAPELLTLIREDQRIAKGEIGLLDHDPICSCQDSDGLKITAVQVTPTGRNRAKANVAFVNGGHPVSVRLSLLRQTGRWRILDIKEPTIPSLRRYLKDGLAKSRTSGKP
jgi:Protein of unknown function (DUF3828)